MKKLGSIISKFVDFSPKNHFWYGPNRTLMNYVFLRLKSTNFEIIEPSFFLSPLFLIYVTNF